jgi:hypothetical protein
VCTGLNYNGIRFPNERGRTTIFLSPLNLLLSRGRHIIAIWGYH